MRVVFLEDVPGVAQGGEVKDVRNGFARNYLIPKSLAVPATHNALQRVERLKKSADETRLKTLADMSTLAEQLDGLQVNIEMRAGTGGRLYGSVTNTMVAEELSKLADREIDRRTIQIAEPIRQLGTFEINARLHPEVGAKVKVLVYAAGTDPTAQEEASEAAEIEEEAPAAEVTEAEEEAAEEEAPTAEVTEAEKEVAEEEEAPTAEEEAPATEEEEEVAEEAAEEEAPTAEEEEPAAEEEVVEEEEPSPKEEVPEEEAEK